MKNIFIFILLFIIITFVILLGIDQINENRLCYDCNYPQQIKDLKTNK